MKLNYFLFRPIDGVSTYNVIPFEAGPYFNKIQCFCFEEQRLNPGEEVKGFFLYLLADLIFFALIKLIFICCFGIWVKHEIKVYYSIPDH